MYGRHISIQTERIFYFVYTSNYCMWIRVRAWNVWCVCGVCLSFPLCNNIYILYYNIHCLCDCGAVAALGCARANKAFAHEGRPPIELGISTHMRVCARATRRNRLRMARRRAHTRLKQNECVRAPLRVQSVSSGNSSRRRAVLIGFTILTSIICEAFCFERLHTFCWGRILGGSMPV